MRFNKYVREYRLEELHLLYNMVNDAIIVVDPKLFDSIEPYLKKVDAIESVNAELYHNLVNYDFIVPDECNETDDLINSWKEEDLHPKDIKLTINPTLQCNLRCWYCYEDHTGHSKISPDTIEAVKRLIDKILDRPHPEKLTLDFFGGEPLLYFNQCVWPLIEYATEAAKLKHKHIGIGFTTNGVLLTDNVCSKLKEVDGPVSLQITLDGDRERHNKTRGLPSGVGTFDTIVANIKRALGCGFDVTVRYNYTTENYQSYQSLLPEFDGLDDRMKSHLNFSFHRVWQETATTEMENGIITTKEDYSTKGFEVNIPVDLGTGRCYADNVNNLVINYNGLVYRCTARDFSPENAEGRLMADGNIEWNERFNRREQVKYGTKVCHECAIFPICHNGCSQNKLEQPDSDDCPQKHTENSKEQMAKKRATQILQFQTSLKTQKL